MRSLVFGPQIMSHKYSPNNTATTDSDAGLGDKYNVTMCKYNALENIVPNKGENVVMRDSSNYVVDARTSEPASFFGKFYQRIMFNVHCSLFIDN